MALRTSSSETSPWPYHTKMLSTQSGIIFVVTGYGIGTGPDGGRSTENDGLTIEIEKSATAITGIQSFNPLPKNTINVKLID